uniref:Intraflagellar transport protein 57 homolog n=1 Tax=Rhabditophanes sp. KR3021 TaxID=114890 RepID=A0AC35U3Q5_9BILA
MSGIPTIGNPQFTPMTEAIHDPTAPENQAVDFEGTLRQPPVSYHRKSISEQSPGAEFNSYETGDELMDKLKLLKYETEFVSISSSHKRIHKYYFVKSTNTGEQYFLFTNLASWLIKKCGRKDFEMPEEYDDPTITLGRIMSEVKKMNLDEEFPQAKIRTGSGDVVIQLLDALANNALAYANFDWISITRPDETKENDEAELLEDIELVAEQYEDDTDEIPFAKDNDDMDHDGIPDISLDSSLSHEQDLSKTATLQQIIKSEVSIEQWNTEVERVTPQLKITLRSDATDWRFRQEQMSKYFEELDNNFNTMKPNLLKIKDSVDNDLERIDSREKHLNSQLDPILQQYRISQDKLAEVRERYREQSQGLDQRSIILTRKEEEVDQLKQEIEDQGNRNSDGAPMVRIKQAISKLERDIVKLTIQISIIEQFVMMNSLDERKQISITSANIGPARKVF